MNLSLNLVVLLYLVASVCFIQALKGLSHPSTSRAGNAFGMVGMAIAAVTTVALVLKKTLLRFHAGGGVAKDIDNMQYLAENMLGRTFCPLGDAAAMPTIGFVKKFRKEFEDHLEGRPCPYEKEGVEEVPVMAH